MGDGKVPSISIQHAFHGACFGADSAPILSAQNTRRASAAFEKKIHTMNIDHVSIGADFRAD